MSKFNYIDNSVGTIATWQQQQDSASPTRWAYQYDGADQLLSATKASSTSAILANMSTAMIWQEIESASK